MRVKGWRSSHHKEKTSHPWCSVAVILLFAYAYTDLCSGSDCEYLINGQRKWCFLFRQTVLSWSDAVKNCSAEGASLVKIANQETQNFMNEQLRNRSWTNSWIGAQERAFPWRWEDGTHANTTFQAWGPNQPDGNFGGDPGCAVMSRFLNFSWDDDFCARPLNFICQRTQAPRSPPCNNETSLFKQVALNGTCFHLMKTKLSWFNSKFACQDIGARLASVDKEEIHNMLREEASKLNVLFGFWIGLSRKEWIWTDGEVVGRPHWESDQPNRPSSKCARIEKYILGGQKQYLWGNWNCASKHYFTCTKEILPETTTITTESTLQTTTTGQTSVVSSASAGKSTKSAFSVSSRDVTWKTASSTGLSVAATQSGVSNEQPSTVNGPSAVTSNTTTTTTTTLKSDLSMTTSDIAGPATPVTVSAGLGVSDITIVAITVTCVVAAIIVGIVSIFVCKTVRRDARKENYQEFQGRVDGNYNQPLSNGEAGTGPHFTRAVFSRPSLNKKWDETPLTRDMSTSDYERGSTGDVETTFHKIANGISKTGRSSGFVSNGLADQTLAYGSRPLSVNTWDRTPNIRRMPEPSYATPVKKKTGKKVTFFDIESKLSGTTIPEADEQGSELSDDTLDQKDIYYYAYDNPDPKCQMSSIADEQTLKSKVFLRK